MRLLGSRPLSLSLRLAVATLSLSLLVAALATGVQLMVAYHDEVATLNQRLDEVERSTVPTLSTSLWMIDKDRVKALLDGLANIPDVAYVRLDSEGARFERGSPDYDPLIERSYALSYDQGGLHPLGTLHLAVDRQLVMNKLRHDSISLGLTTLITLLAASLSLLLLFRQWVTRHLEVMAHYARELTIDSLQTPLVLPRRPLVKRLDEIGQVVYAFNRMRERMLHEFAVRSSHEQEMLAHHQRLETQVQARTYELEQQTHQLEAQKIEMQRLADTDSLTGVSSRRSFLERVALEIKRSRGGRHALSLLMVDVDHFKRINDGHGHAVGDRALAAIAQICVQQLREVDIMGRMGGEEFAVLLPDADLPRASAIAERLRSAVERSRLSLGQGASIGTTLSVGASELSDPEDDVETLLARADAALYSAKRAGRNRVQAEPVAAPDV